MNHSCKCWQITHNLGTEFEEFKCCLYIYIVKIYFIHIQTFSHYEFHESLRSESTTYVGVKFYFWNVKCILVKLLDSFDVYLLLLCLLTFFRFFILSRCFLITWVNFCIVKFFCHLFYHFSLIY